MRSALLLLVEALVLGVSGCLAPSGAQEETQPEPQPAMLASQREPYLLFDRRPSPVYAPQHSAIRSAWPVAERGFSAGEWVEFEERLIDREWGFNHANDLTYRRFSSRRRGVSFR